MGLLFSALALLAAAPSSAAAAAPDTTNQLRLERTVRYLQEVQNLDGGYGGRAGGASDVLMTCWVAVGIAAAGVNPRDQAKPGGVDAWTYIERHTTTYDQTTDYERTLLAAVAAGESGRDVGGTDLIARILERQGSDGGVPQQPGGSAYVNATAFAILSLSSSGDPAAPTAIQRATDWLIAHQRANGAWGSSAPGSLQDADITGAVIQALARAGRRGSDAEQRALDFLRTLQNDDGGFGEVNPGEESNSGSTAWVVQGLWAAGVDPRDWRRSGGDPLDYLASLQQSDGSVVWKVSQPAANPVWMTAYAAPAFAGLPLPISAPPRSVTPPAKPPTEETPGTVAPDPIPGQGGFDSGHGGGVIAGGGGRGARLFSRPRPQSQGSTPGGVRHTRSTPRDPSARVPPHDDQAAASPSARPAGSLSRRHLEARRRRRATRMSHGRGAAASGTQVTGHVIGAGATGRATAIAPGLLGAQAGGNPSSGLAIGITCGLTLCALLGSQLERRRPSHPA